MWKLFEVTLSNLNFYNVVAREGTRSTCCGLILILVRYSPTQMYALMKTVYGNHVLGHATIFHWHAFFAVGSASAATLPRSSWPKTSSTESMVKTIKAIIMEGRSLIVRELPWWFFFVFFLFLWSLVRWIQTGFTQFVVMQLLRFYSGWNLGCLCKFDQATQCACLEYTYKWWRGNCKNSPP